MPGRGKASQGPASLRIWDKGGGQRNVETLGGHFQSDDTVDHPLILREVLRRLPEREDMVGLTLHSHRSLICDRQTPDKKSLDMLSVLFRRQSR